MWPKFYSDPDFPLLWKSCGRSSEDHRAVAAAPTRTRGFPPPLKSEIARGHGCYTVDGDGEVGLPVAVDIALDQHAPEIADEAQLASGGEGGIGRDQGEGLVIGNLRVGVDGGQ